MQNRFKLLTIYYFEFIQTLNQLCIQKPIIQINTTSAYINILKIPISIQTIVLIKQMSSPPTKQKIGATVVRSPSPGKQKITIPSPSPTKQKINTTTLPGSGAFGKKLLDLKNIHGKIISRQYVLYVLGISGGDCSGKKQLLNHMFSTDQHGKRYMRNDDNRQRVTIIHQDYFLSNQKLKFQSSGYNWREFEKAILELLAGNQYKIQNAKLKGLTITLIPSKLIVLQGSHIFMQTHQIHKYIDAKFFVDSDSDVRLSRRVFKDTQDNNITLPQCIKNYLNNIKTSYQQEIQPCKSICDMIIPPFGDSFNDHRKVRKISIISEKFNYYSNIGFTSERLLAKIKQEMAKEISNELSNDLK